MCNKTEGVNMVYQQFVQEKFILRQKGFIL